MGAGARGAALRAAARIAEALIGVPAMLPEALARRHPELRAVRWRRGGLPPRIGGWAIGRPSVAGITLWNTVFLAPDAPWSASLLLHELRHVHQFHESRAFPLRYLWESLRRGYRQNRFELDADRYAAVRLGASLTEPSREDS